MQVYPGLVSEIHSNLSYFGGYRTFKFRLVLSCSKFFKDTETALKPIYPASIPKIVFAYDALSMVAVGTRCSVNFLDLFLYKFFDFSKIYVSKNLKVPLNCKFAHDPKSGLKSTYPPVGKTYKRFIDRYE